MTDDAAAIEQQIDELIESMGDPEYGGAPSMRQVRALLTRLLSEPRTYNGHIDPDCEVLRGVGGYCTCATPKEKAEAAQYRAECEAERDAFGGVPSPPPPTGGQP